MADRKKPPLRSSLPTEARLGWRMDEFSELFSVSREQLWKLEKKGEIRLARLGRISIVPRHEAVRLGLIAA
jgi:hypothetical protein